MKIKSAEVCKEHAKQFLSLFRSGNRKGFKKMKKKILLSIMLMCMNIFAFGLLNVSANENAEVYIDGKENSAITAKLVDGDAYICVQDFFEYFDYEVESTSYYNSNYVWIYTDVYNERWEKWEKERVAYFYRRDYKTGEIKCDEIGIKHFDVNLSDFTKGRFDDYEYELTKPMLKDDIEHLYAYYKDIQVLLDFDIMASPEMNTVAIYIKKDVPDSITLYDKKGNATEICPLFEDKYLEAGYKKNKDDVLLFPESKIVSADGIKVSLNGSFLEFDIVPTTINDRTMVPLRAIFEALNATVDWNSETQTVTSKKGDTIITITVDSDQMSVNNKSITLDCPATVINGRTLVPVRAISESFGLDVGWDELNSRVILREAKYSNAATSILYNLSNQVIEVPDFDTASYISNGWLTEKPITMYALDGRTQLVAANEVDANKKVGWYTQPVITMYAPDGRTQAVAKKDVESYKSVGWYDYPVTTMYALDGRTIVISSSEVQNYINVGWYTADKYYIMQYSYLAGSDFRAIRNKYPHAVAHGAYLYPYTDSNGDNCILVYISYKIENNWNAYYLHNLSQGSVIENPADYYNRLAGDYWGSDKIKYMNLQKDALSAQANALKGFAGATDKGIAVDAATLNK